MREIAGAIERPADSEIEIKESPNETWIHIPAPRLPWIVYAGGIVAFGSIIAVIVGGALVFLFQKPFPGYDAVVGGQFAPQPLSWRLAGLLGWLLISPALIVLMAAAIRPVTRTEKIFLPNRATAYSDMSAAFLVLNTRELGLTRSRQIALSDILRFELHRDPQGLIESEIVIETQSALDQGRNARRSTVAGATSEAEKEWLASALNALLACTRGAERL